jgi:single-stranded-DNA-specific exonuclease
VRDADAAAIYFKQSLANLHDPKLLPGACRAAERIVEALRKNQRIVIYGDYDVDGVTATAILYHTLKAADPAARVTCYVPHRLDEGYGLNAEAIAALCDDGAELIISVDCGITACGPAAVAKQRGVDLIITDHHEMDDTLPEAFALVHPRLPHADAERGEASGTLPYPFPEICGAGVAYKLAWQIARTWCNSDRVSQTFRALLIDLLPLAALGTIADVVPLVGENRVIAHCGLKRIRHTPFAGLDALIVASRLEDEQKIDSYHVGFVLGPRLNACGRMGHAREAVKLLTDATVDEAREIADMLNKANDHRRATERQIFEQAAQCVTDHGYDRDDVRAIVLADESWHKGVVGIVCSRLVERFGRPTVLLSLAEGEASGSARSIDGFNIHEAFTACASHLTKFGGHAMAAGLTLADSSVDAFRAAMIDYAAERLTVDDLVPVLQVDAAVELAALSPDVVSQIKRMEPFGRDNRKPRLLIRGAKLHQPARTMGQKARHLSMILNQNGDSMRAIAWSMGDLAERLPAGSIVDVVAEPTLNTWNGRTNVELVVEDLRWCNLHES